MSGETEVDGSAEEAVKRNLEELKCQVEENLDSQSLKDGTWFVWLTQKALKTYAVEVDAGWFRRKYPSLPPDTIADRRVSLAKRYAAIAGGLNAAAYTGLIALTIGSAGGASAITGPAAVGSFGVDLLYTTRLQLTLAYDLSVLYEHPVDMEDPEDLYDLLTVAFGIRAAESLQNALTKFAPEAARLGVRAVASGSRLALLKSIPVVGKYLLQRNLIKFAIPVICVPLSAGVNFYTTGSIARQAKAIFRKRAEIRVAGESIARAVEDSPLLALRAIFLVVHSDRKVTDEEARLIQRICEVLAKNEGAAAVEEFKQLIEVKEQDLLEDLRKAPTDCRKLTYEAARRAAMIDGVLHKRERKLLRALASACGVDYEDPALPD